MNLFSFLLVLPFYSNITPPYGLDESALGATNSMYCLLGNPLSPTSKLILSAALGNPKSPGWSTEVSLLASKGLNGLIGPFDILLGNRLFIFIFCLEFSCKMKTLYLVYKKLESVRDFNRVCFYAVT